MLWAQWTAMVLMLIGFGVEMALIGKPREPRGWGDIFTSLISLTLLACAGTFSLILGWPK